MSNKQDYWDETLANSFESQGAWDLFKQLTEDQRSAIAEDLECAHENYGMAFYSPPSSERYDQINDEWRRKYNDLKKEYDKYIGNAERAVKQALRQHSDSNVSIGEYGEVFRHDGRYTQIQ